MILRCLFTSLQCILGGHPATWGRRAVSLDGGKEKEACKTDKNSTSKSLALCLQTQAALSALMSSTFSAGNFICTNGSICTHYERGG